MKLSVVVPTFNRRDIVKRTLSTLFIQDASPDSFEIIVVDDGSSDGTADELKLLRPACRFRVIEQKNRGPSAARNTGYRVAENNLILFIDDDMLCDSYLVTEHLSAHREGGRIAAFGALFISPDSAPSLAAECFKRELGDFYLRERLQPGAEWQIGDCVFSNSSLSRNLLEEVGGFDEDFRVREDLDLGVRLLDVGVHPVYIGKAIAYQYYCKSSAELVRDAEAFAVGDVMFARKHPHVRLKGHLRDLSSASRVKRALRYIAAISPSAADCILAPVCRIGDVFFAIPFLKKVGIAALQKRRRIHWLHRVLEIEKL